MFSKKNIDALKENDIYLEMIRAGNTPEEIKELLQDMFSPYFKNLNVLLGFSVDILLPELVNLAKVQQNPQHFYYFEEVLSNLNNSKIISSEICYKTVGIWNNAINLGISNLMSCFLLEQRKGGLGIEEFAIECFRTIGDLIEGSLKPFICHLLHQINIMNGSNIESTYFDNKDLGNIIDELIQKSPYSDLFATMAAGNRVKMNQWRNISFHKNYKIDRNQIYCEIKNKNIVRNSFYITRQELFDILVDIHEKIRAIKLAYTVFFLDNLKEIKIYLESSTIHKEAELLSFVLGINSQGFDMVRYSYCETETKIILKDVISTPDNCKERMMHASQLLFLIWKLFRSTTVSLDYMTNDEQHIVTFKIEGAICEKIYNGELDPLEQANEMEIIWAPGVLLAPNESASE